MSVIINVIGSKPKSDEYQCALQLKNIFEKELPKTAIGEIILHANATLVGQTVKDIDLLMMGTLQNFSLPLSFTDVNQEIKYDNVKISTFCTTIEIKSHSIEGIFREGTEFYVKYGLNAHSVTSQSNEQKISTMNFFKRSLGFSPYVTNVIWFTGITKTELDELLTIDKNKMPSNVLSNSFTLKELMQLVVFQKTPHLHIGKYCCDANFRSQSPDDLHRIFQILAEAKNAMGLLTRKRIEQITSKAIAGNLKKPSPDKITIYRGRAGTGKTVGLIQMAINLVDESNARVLILTYNRALVSDIRRLFTLAELPDMFESACVEISTMESFFYKIIRDVLCDGVLSGEEYLKNYDSFIQEMVDFLRDDEEAINLVKDLLHKSLYLSWDYCFIDEAQDWTSQERDLIIDLFGIDHIVIADGGQQFVKSCNACDWNIVSNRQNIKLKYCLRQKSNLVKFINHCIEGLGNDSNKILSSNHLLGGKVLICSQTTDFWKVCNNELQVLKSAGNIPYDMLFLVPSSMVDTKGERQFLYKKEFEQHNFFIWDGTNNNTRLNFSLLGDEERVLQYDSARGLEAWTVVCLEFDTFLEEKLLLFDDSKRGNQLFLESVEDRKIKYLLNWLLIPLTRAIDTIVITLRDENSEISLMLKKIAIEHPDYITFIKED